jgi:hypothetical protein
MYLALLVHVTAAAAIAATAPALRHRGVTGGSAAGVVSGNMRCCWNAPPSPWHTAPLVPRSVAADREVG